MKNIKKIRIEGNGNQAPYGIGEIIEIYPAAHWRKIQRLVGSYYNPPAMRCNDCGAVLDWIYDYDNAAGIEGCCC